MAPHYHYSLSYSTGVLAKSDLLARIQYHYVAYALTVTSHEV